MTTQASHSGAKTEENRTELRSSRWVTSGYRNVFHRAFLYGMGLTDHDMKQPFAGLALAHNEATPGQAMVRSLGDLAKRSASAAGFTERQFVVPETRAAPETNVAYRELAADSAELAIRGHWYDALIGVSASVPSAFGLAQAIVRLGIPGVVLIPAERLALDPNLAVAAEVLEAVGLGAVVSVEDSAALTDRLKSLRELVVSDVGETVDITERRSQFCRTLPGTATNGAVFAHVCALAFELGIEDGANLINENLRHITVGTVERPVSSIGPVPTVDAQLVVDDSNPERPTLNDEYRQHYVVMAADARGPVFDANEGAVVLVPTTGDVEFIARQWRVDVECTEVPVTNLFSTAVVAGCTHPGYVDSALNYDRL